MLAVIASLRNGKLIEILLQKFKNDLKTGKIDIYMLIQILKDLLPLKKSKKFRKSVRLVIQGVKDENMVGFCIEISSQGVTIVTLRISESSKFIRDLYLPTDGCFKDNETGNVNLGIKKKKLFFNIYLEHKATDLIKNIPYLVKCLKETRKNVLSNCNVNNNNLSEKDVSKGYSEKHVQMDDANLDRLESEAIIHKRPNRHRCNPSFKPIFLNKHKMRPVKETEKKKSERRKAREKERKERNLREYDKELQAPFFNQAPRKRSSDVGVNTDDMGMEGDHSSKNDDKVTRLNRHPLAYRDYTISESLKDANGKKNRKGKNDKASKSNKNKKANRGYTDSESWDDSNDKNRFKPGPCDNVHTESTIGTNTDDLVGGVVFNDLEKDKNRADSLHGDDNSKASTKRNKKNKNQFKDSEDDTYLGLTSTFGPPTDKVKNPKAKNRKSNKRKPVSAKFIDDNNEKFEKDNIQLKDDIISAEAARVREDERIRAIKNGEINAFGKGDKYGNQDIASNEHLEQIRRMKEIEINRLKKLEEQRKQCKAIAEEKARRQEMKRLLEKEKCQQGSYNIGIQNSNLQKGLSQKLVGNSSNRIVNRKETNSDLTTIKSAKDNSNRLFDNVILPIFTKNNKNYTTSSSISSQKVTHVVVESGAIETVNNDPKGHNGDKLDRIVQLNSNKNKATIKNKLSDHFTNHINLQKSSKIQEQKLKRENHLKTLEEERKLLKERYVENARHRENIRLIKRSMCQQAQEHKQGTYNSSSCHYSSTGSLGKYQSHNSNNGWQGMYNINGTEYPFTNIVRSTSHIANRPALHNNFNQSCLSRHNGINLIEPQPPLILSELKIKNRKLPVNCKILTRMPSNNNFKDIQKFEKILRENYGIRFITS